MRRLVRIDVTQFQFSCPESLSDRDERGHARAKIPQNLTFLLNVGLIACSGPGAGFFVKLRGRAEAQALYRFDLESKIPRTITAKLPTYQSDREKWRKGIHKRVRQAAVDAGVKYNRDDSESDSHGMTLIKETRIERKSIVMREAAIRGIALDYIQHVLDQVPQTKPAFLTT